MKLIDFKISTNYHIKHSLHCDGLDNMYSKNNKG